MKRAMNRQEYEAIAIPHQARVGVKLSPNVSMAAASLLFKGLRGKLHSNEVLVGVEIAIGLSTRALYGIFMCAFNRSVHS
jgi:hypothetical protein